MPGGDPNFVRYSLSRGLSDSLPKKALSFIRWLSRPVKIGLEEALGLNCIFGDEEVPLVISPNLLSDSGRNIQRAYTIPMGTLIPISTPSGMNLHR